MSRCPAVSWIRHSVWSLSGYDEVVAGAPRRAPLVETMTTASHVESAPWTAHRRAPLCHDASRSALLLADWARQIVLGRFDLPLNHMLDDAIDLTRYKAKFRNDTAGALARAPCCSSSSWSRTRACWRISARSRARATSMRRSPRSAVIGHLVGTLGEDIAHLFAAVTSICDAKGL